jgi:putative DNA primase/helicase
MEIDPPDYCGGRQQADVPPYPYEAPATARAHGNGAAINGHAHGTPDEQGAAVAVCFLERFHPGTLWALAAFGPGDNEVGPAETFDPSIEQDRDAAYRFILKLQGKHNAYFTVNAVVAKTSKKASKHDIAEIHYLYVDADLNKKLDWSNPAVVAAEKQRVLSLLRAYGPPPTAIVWSGGGFQAFWRLSKIIVVNGDKDLMAPIERRMRRIEQAFGADSCHNADRIMRIPGSMNVLGPTKVRAGRKPDRADLIEFYDDRIYDLEDFPEIDPEPSHPNGAGSGGGHHHHHREADDFERARDALRSIPADDYDMYKDIGMALMNGFGDEGFSLYREWAMKSIKFKDNNIRTKWKSFSSDGGITVATLFYTARKYGWRDANGARSRSSRDEQAASTEQAPGSDEPDMSIVRRNRTPAPEFPLDVLGSAADWVKTTAASKSAPISYVALGLFVTAAGCIGPKRRVSPWDGWDEPSILWGALVGEPSLIKSPSMDPFRDAVRAIERGVNADWEVRRADFEKQKQAAEESRSQWEKAVKQAVKDRKEPPSLPEEAREPRSPTKARLWIVDATAEKVARILGENPSGLISFRDELAGLLGGFDKYGGSGSDRAFWIEAYGGRPYRYDRVSLDEPIDIPFCAVSLIGALQPDRLNTMLLSGDDDGLAARPLYAWPDPVPPRRPTKGADQATVQSVLQRLWDLSFDVDAGGNARPRTKHLETDAANEFQAWWEHKQWNAKLSAGGRLAGAIGKLDGVALRLAQVLELLEWAWRGSNEVEPEFIGVRSVRHALCIIDDWVRPNLDRVFAEASLPQVQRDAMIVGRWLLKTEPKNVNARDLRRQPGFPGPKDAKELDPALEFLVDAHWLKAVSTTGQGRGQGRPRKDYTVNEAIYKKAAKA